MRSITFSNCIEIKPRKNLLGCDAHSFTFISISIEVPNPQRTQSGPPHWGPSVCAVHAGSTPGRGHAVPAQPGNTVVILQELRATKDVASYIDCTGAMDQITTRVSARPDLNWQAANVGAVLDNGLCAAQWQRGVLVHPSVQQVQQVQQDAVLGC